MPREHSEEILQGNTTDLIWLIWGIKIKCFIDVFVNSRRSGKGSNHFENVCYCNLLGYIQYY